MTSVTYFNSKKSPQRVSKKSLQRVSRKSLQRVSKKRPQRVSKKSPQRVSRKSLQRVSIKSQSGFVLPGTLAVLVVLTIFVGFFAAEVAVIKDRTLALQQDRTHMLEQQAAEATILYMLATRPVSYAGLTVDPHEPGSGLDELDPFNYDPYWIRGGEIKLNGTPYKAFTSTHFNLQDTGSLISLRNENSTILDRLLWRQGIDRPDRVRMLGMLRDYIDQDDVSGVDGGEKETYQEPGAAPPTNRFLSSPMQLLNVATWDDAFARQDFYRFLQEVTIFVADRQNPNTMTQTGMQTVLRLDEQTAAEIVKQRNEKAITDLSEFSRETGIQMRPGYAVLVPMRHFRLTLWNRDTHLEHEDSQNEDAQYRDTQYEDTYLQDPYGDTHQQNEEPWNTQLEDTHLQYDPDTDPYGETNLNYDDPRNKKNNQTWIGISLTPDSPLAPWEIGYRMKIEPPDGLENPAEDPYESDFAGFSADDFAANDFAEGAGTGNFNAIKDRARFPEISRDVTAATVAQNRNTVAIDPPSPLLRQWLPEAEE